MNDFEFLRSINIGEYLPGESPVHRLDPRAKIVIFTVYILALTFTRSLGGLALGLLFILGGLLLARIPLRFAMRGLLAPLPFLLFLALLQLFLTPPANPGDVLWQWRFLQISGAGVMAATTLLARFTALILAIGLSTSVTSSSDLLAGMNALLRPLGRIGVPAEDAVMTVQVALRFLPLLAVTAERTAKAQASRGADWSPAKGNLVKQVKRIAPMIVPLFISSLGKAERMALAMDARAYGSHRPRGSMRELVFTWKDAAAVIVALLLCAAVFAVP
jgi:energy-coupling factor transport system permease protein